MESKREIIVSDSNHHAESISIDFFYPDPKKAQSLCRTIFTSLFARDIDFYSLEGLFYTTINRFFLTDIKLLEHSLIAENLLDYCASNHVKKVVFRFDPRNRLVFEFYHLVLKTKSIKSEVKFEKCNSFWKNSLTKESFSVRAKNHLAIVLTFMAQYSLLSLNSILRFRKLSLAKKVVLWHSFANNREKVDYKILDEMDNFPNVSVLHPNPYLFKSRKNWNKSIYFLGKFSLRPTLYAKVMLKFLFFRKKFNRILDEFEYLVPFRPTNWNSTSMKKTILFLNYNLLSGGLIENLSKKDESEMINIFRGGAAAGLIYSGKCKEKYKNARITNILVPHGTEFSPIDHFSYFYLDFNILPSEKIKQSWETTLLAKYSNWCVYNKCTLTAGGRIDYQLFDERVKVTRKQGDSLRIGIVLTYNSPAYQDKYISDVIEVFESKYSVANCFFLIKPRSNFFFSPGASLKSKNNVVVFKKDIFHFLNEVDLIIGTVSSYGILTMVVTDSIYCDIPALYYLPNEKFNFENLGYSFHESMQYYAFNDKHVFGRFLAENDNKEKLLSSLRDLNARTKEYLLFRGDPKTHLFNLIRN